MTTKQNKLTDNELVHSCRHSRLREALMSHTPQTRTYRSAAVLPAPSVGLSLESKFYAGVALLATISLICHAIVGIASY